MEIKHTEGEWEIEKRKNFYKADGSKEEMELLKSINKISFEAISVGTKNGQIAIVPTDEFPNEYEANAKLMAAAPELLEALKFYLNAGSKESRRMASKIAFKAIEKATK